MIHFDGRMWSDGDIRVFIYLSYLFCFLYVVKFAATHLQNMGVGIELWTILMVCPFSNLSR